MIDARIILDSINPCGNRLTTWILVYPRIILAEFNTHRAFSRNSASSRAIPIEKIIGRVKDHPFIPTYWGANQKGMQAAAEIPIELQSDAIEIWLKARDNAIESVRSLLKLNVHKQIVNRLLEPWMYIETLVTGTDFENYFCLRAHPDAQPEFQKLAYLMLEKYNESIPTPVAEGDWHIPFADKHCEGLTLEEKLKVAAARQARVSYANFEGEIDHQKDFDLHDKLFAAGHFSPFESSAQACATPERHGNFVGWKQYRKTLPNECRSDPRVIKHG